MADPFVAEIRIMPTNFPPERLGFLQRAAFAPQPEYRAVFAPGYILRWKREKYLRPARSSGPGPCRTPARARACRTGFWAKRVESHSPRSSNPKFRRTITLFKPPMRPGDSNIPTANAIARSANGSVYGTIGGTVQLAPQALTPAGGSLPHNNMMRYLTLNFVIALQGVYPAHPAKSETAVTLWIRKPSLPGPGWISGLVAPGDEDLLRGYLRQYAGRGNGDDPPLARRGQDCLY